MTQEASNHLGTHCSTRCPIKEVSQIGPKRGRQPVQRFQRGICGSDLDRADERLPKTGLGREVILRQRPFESQPPQIAGQNPFGR